MISSNVIVINEIISDIAIKIQEELNNLHQKYDKTAAKLEVLQEQKQKYQTKIFKLYRQQK